MSEPDNTANEEKTTLVNYCTHTTTRPVRHYTIHDIIHHIFVIRQQTAPPPSHRLNGHTCGPQNPLNIFVSLCVNLATLLSNGYSSKFDVSNSFLIFGTHGAK